MTCIKIDPYLNLDAGLFSPYEHGETFVLDDGGEVDLDLGNYERFLGITLRRENNITTGKIYNEVIQRERRGDFLGKTVQVIPHVCNEIQDWIERVARVSVDDTGRTPDICVIELGGTIGDIESAPFVEALRQFQFRVGRENVCFLHVSLVPTMGEQKTKPTQHSVRELRALGLNPDFIMCRSTGKLEDSTKVKISSFCHVPVSNVIGVHDVQNTYSVPVLLRNQNVDRLILERLGRKFDATVSANGFRYWAELEEKARALDRGDGQAVVHIAVVGKYTGLTDAYLSLVKALGHATLSLGLTLDVVWIEATELEATATEEERSKAEKRLRSADGVLVPGGFGSRGIEGMIYAARYARENNIPYLGVCLGMQVAVIEFARNVLKMEDANSTEFNPRTAQPVVVFMPEGSEAIKGGTMRLGKRDTVFVHKENSVAWHLYGKHDAVSERHRHRYEINPSLVPELEKHGMLFVGRAVGEEAKFGSQQEQTLHDQEQKTATATVVIDPAKAERNEIVEIPANDYFVGVQFHPEFKSTPFKPSPPFLGLVAASAKKLDQVVVDMKKKK